MQAVLVEHFVDAVRQTGLMVGPEVALVAAGDLPGVDEVKICGEDGEALCLESREILIVLMLVDEIVCDLKFGLPGDGGGVLLEELLDELLGHARAPSGHTIRSAGA
jgi:hypothetical protein